MDEVGVPAVAPMDHVVPINPQTQIEEGESDGVRARVERDPLIPRTARNTSEFAPYRSERRSVCGPYRIAVERPALSTSKLTSSPKCP